MRNSVAEARRARGLSQQGLAEVAGVTRQTIISIEKGRYDPSLTLAFELARIFECRIEELFTPDAATAERSGPRGTELEGQD